MEGNIEINKDYKQLKSMWSELEKIDREIENWVNNQSDIVNYFRVTLKEKWAEEMRSISQSELVNDAGLSNRLISRHKHIVSIIFSLINEKITNYESSILSIDDKIRCLIDSLKIKEPSSQLQEKFIPLLKNNVERLTSCLEKFKNKYPEILEQYVSRDRDVICSRCENFK